jgi:8-oxo-dGTP pyrophosphatase MutT (NUDIX family)
MNSSSVVLVFDPEGKVLVLRRGPTDPWRPGYWNFPGGHAEKEDASPKHTATRELAEEAGICLDPGALQWLFSFRDPRRVHVLWVQLSERPDLMSYDGEHDAYDWVDWNNIPQPMLRSVAHIVATVPRL